MGTEWFSPVLMMDVELTEPLPQVPFDGRHRRAWVVGRLHTEPLGVCEIELSEPGLTSDRLGTLLWQELSEAITARFTAAGLAPPGSISGSGLTVNPARWPFLLRREAALAAAPSISVIVPTRGRADRAATWLTCLSRLEYPRFEVVVVDNAPTGDEVRAAVEAARGCGVELRYVAEPRAGTSWAANAGVAAAAGDVITFCADDGEPDPHWLTGLACGFARGDDVGCVTGMVLPARLDTPAQELYEQFSGFRKGRGFAPAIFSREGPQSPLYPVPPFGTGACVAYRRDALADIGGFDVALGPGTPARAAEDVLAMTMVLLAGYRLAYEPAALMRHDHRRDLDGLRSQMEGYGVGLTAYYAALLRHRPGVLPELIRLMPTGAKYLRTANFRRTTAPLELLQGLNRRHRWRMLMGPLAYARSVRRQARVARQSH